MIVLTRLGPAVPRTGTPERLYSTGTGLDPTDFAAAAPAQSLGLRHRGRRRTSTRLAALRGQIGPGNRCRRGRRRSRRPAPQRPDSRTSGLPHQSIGGYRPARAPCCGSGRHVVPARATPLGGAGLGQAQLGVVGPAQARVLPSTVPDTGHRRGRGRRGAGPNPRGRCLRAPSAQPVPAWPGNAGSGSPRRSVRGDLAARELRCRSGQYVDPSGRAAPALASGPAVARRRRAIVRPGSPPIAPDTGHRRGLVRRADGYTPESAVRALPRLCLCCIRPATP